MTKQRLVVRDTHNNLKGVNKLKLPKVNTTRSACVIHFVEISSSVRDKALEENKGSDYKRVVARDNIMNLTDVSNRNNLSE